MFETGLCSLFLLSRLDPVRQMHGYQGYGEDEAEDCCHGGDNEDYFMIGVAGGVGIGCDCNGKLEFVSFGMMSNVPKNGRILQATSA